MKTNCFIYTHIPKCGGTSFRKFINTAGKESGVPFYQRYIPGFNGIPGDLNYDKIGPILRRCLKPLNIKIMAMHAPYGVHTSLLSKEVVPFYFTILRDPLERVLSHYFYFNYKLGRMDLQNVHINDVDSDDLLPILKKISNLSINYISGHGMNGGLGNSQTLKVAKENLMLKYNAYGLIDTMPETIKNLQDNGPDWLRFSPSFPFMNSNKAGYLSEIEDRVIEQISTVNRYELDFYEFALLNYKKPLSL